MSKKNFLLLSLEDEKAKKVANAVTNESCKKILDFLAENEATETEISEKLKIPMPTVHYNLKQLMQARLIDWEKYHYSEKGKEVKHYKLANKYIIIAPRGEDKESMREKLKSIIPTFALGIIGTGLLYSSTSNPETANLATAKIASAEIAEDSAESFAADGARAFEDEAIPQALSLAPEPPIYSNPDIALWFFLGIIFTIVTYFIIDAIRKRYLKKKTSK